MSGLTPLPDNVPLDPVKVPAALPSGAPFVGMGTFNGQSYPMYGEAPQAGPTPLPDDAQLDHSSQSLGFLKGVTRPWDNAAHWLSEAVPGLDAVGQYMGMPSSGEVRQQHQDYFKQRENAGEQPGAIGDFAGNMLATIPLAVATKNPWIGGAAYGALNTEHPDSAKDVAWDAGVSALGNKAGGALISGIGKAVSPVVNPLVQALLDRGVRMTPGQIVGGTTQKLEDAATHLPFIGPMINAARNRSFSDFNTGAINQALEPLTSLERYGISGFPAKLPPNLPSGHEAIKFAKDTLGDAYNAILPRTNFQVDMPFIQNVGKIVQMAKDLPEREGGQLQSLIKSYVIDPIAKAGGLTGEGYKEVYSKLGSLTRQYGKSGDVFQRSIGDGIKQIRVEMRDALYRNNPEMQGALKAVDTGYAHLKRVIGAAASPGAQEGVFSPTNLAQAVRRQDGSVDKGASAIGEALMQRYAEAGKAVLPSKVGDSGTALRTLIQNGLGSLAAGGGAFAHGVVPSLVLGAKAAPVLAPVFGAYTKRGSQIVGSALTKRPASAQALAAALAKLEKPASYAGSAAASELDSGR